MLTYELDRNIFGSYYEHLYRCLKNDIEKGNLKAHEKLPSKRNFAENLGVSTITVENAYDQLISEGYVYSVPRRGYFIADISRSGLTLTAQRPFSDVGEEEFSSAAAEDAPASDLPGSACQMDLSANAIDPENFPFTTWKKLLREILSENNQDLMTRSPGAGIAPLRKAIARHLLSFRSMKVRPDQIILGAGTEYLYTLLAQLLGMDKTYCTEDPGYQKLAMIYKSLGISCSYAQMDEYGITVPSLSMSGADIVHICPTHHFPTGITMPIGRRYELLAWANEKDARYIIEDDYDSEFRLRGRPIPAMQSIDLSGRVIYMNTFSMSLTPTIRISYMVLPPDLAAKFYREMNFYSCTVSNFEQYTLARFIDEGYFEKHINRMRRFYAKRRDQVIDLIGASRLKGACRIIEKDAGMHFILHLDTKKDDRELTDDLARKGLSLKALSQFYMDKSSAASHDFILSYSCLDMERLPGALELIAGSL